MKKIILALALICTAALAVSSNGIAGNAAPCDNPSCEDRTLPCDHRDCGGNRTLPCDDPSCDGRTLPCDDPSCL